MCKKYLNHYWLQKSSSYTLKYPFWLPSGILFGRKGPKMKERTCHWPVCCTRQLRQLLCLLSNIDSSTRFWHDSKLQPTVTTTAMTNMLKDVLFHTALDSPRVSVSQPFSERGERVASRTSPRLRESMSAGLDPDFLLLFPHFGAIVRRLWSMYAKKSGCNCSHSPTSTVGSG